MPVLLQMHWLRRDAASDAGELLRVLLLWFGPVPADSSPAFRSDRRGFLLCRLSVHGQRYRPKLARLASQSAHESGCVVDSPGCYYSGLVEPAAAIRPNSASTTAHRGSAPRSTRGQKDRASGSRREAGGLARLLCRHVRSAWRCDVRLRREMRRAARCRFVGCTRRGRLPLQRRHVASQKLNELLQRDRITGAGFRFPAIHQQATENLTLNYGAPCASSRLAEVPTKASRLIAC
jgi:hypothetical protein